uniref:DNL-type domain-containing protein n=2 Tax=Nelumbo nucifera TaxID=4432 RepID=A0A822XGF9_NELNU|nr:TPA_asm: hypothetical protein HUJ06_020465 [Nelumbo nucifera]
METLTSSATIMSSSSPLSIFSPKKNLSTKPLRFPIASKNDDNDADLRSNSNQMNIAPLSNDGVSLSPLSQDAAMGLVLSAATGRGWTTGSGMEGPSIPAGSESESNTDRISTFPWSLFTKSPRRRMRVAFTCNVCGQRTTRAINPHAYTDGTVFVQCYVNPSFRYMDPTGDVSFKYLDMGDDNEDDDIFPVL